METVKLAAADLKDTDSIPRHFDYGALSSETLEAICEGEAFLATGESSRFDIASNPISAVQDCPEA